jgi:hypothetical protein
MLKGLPQKSTKGNLKFHGLPFVAQRRRDYTDYTDFFTCLPKHFVRKMVIPAEAGIQYLRSGFRLKAGMTSCRTVIPSVAKRSRGIYFNRPLDCAWGDVFCRT